jgi:hypothetical protein
MTMSLPIQSSPVWKSAELLIAFFRDPKGVRRDKPFVWNPKNSRAALVDRDHDQEAFVQMEASDGRDVQLRLQPSSIVARRETGSGWNGVVISDTEISIQIGETWIHVRGDGSIRHDQHKTTTFVEPDGSIIRLDPLSKITVSADGSRVARKTDEKLEAFTPEGFVSKKL